MNILIHLNGVPLAIKPGTTIKDLRELNNIPNNQVFYRLYAPPLKLEEAACPEAGDNLVTRNPELIAQY